MGTCAARGLSRFWKREYVWCQEGGGRVKNIWATRMAEPEDSQRGRGVCRVLQAERGLPWAATCVQAPGLRMYTLGFKAHVAIQRKSTT